MKKFRLFTCLVLVLVFLTSCTSKLNWSDGILTHLVPEPISKNGEITTNYNDHFTASIHKISPAQYNQYISQCKEQGFSIESEETGSMYTSYNQDGYKLVLSYYESDNQMNISIHSPMEFGTFSWPTSELAKLLPIPNSTVGEISFDTSDELYIYVGNMNKDAYNEYVNACSNAGFNIDYSRGDTYYYADNSSGYSLDLTYTWYNTISISLDAPDEIENSDDTTSIIETPNDNNTVLKEDSSNLDWKQFLKDYEAWVDDYIAFMDKYTENPSDLSLLTDYTKMVGELADWASRADDMELEIEDSADATEYASELARISAKIAEIAY